MFDATSLMSDAWCFFISIGFDAGLNVEYCQAQAKSQPKLGAELVLISNNPATHPPIHSPTRISMKELEFNSDQKTKVALLNE